MRPFDCHRFFVMLALAAGLLLCSVATVAADAVYTFTTLAGVAGALVSSADGTGSAAQFSAPRGLAVDGSGNVYVADSSNHTVRKMTATGVVTTLAGSAGSSGNVDGTGTAARFNEPFAVAVDAAGNVFVADTNNNAIRKITPSGVVTTLAGGKGNGAVDGVGTAAKFHEPRGIAIDSSGTLYVADYENQLVRKVSTDGTVTTLAGGADMVGNTNGQGNTARFMSLQGIALDGAGNVYVTESGNRDVRKITPSGMVTTLVDGSNGVFGELRGIAVDSGGNLFVGDYGANAVHKITSTGSVSTFAGTKPVAGSVDGTGANALFNGVSGIAIDSAGNLYVADTLNNTIRKISATGVVTTFAGMAGRTNSVDGSSTVARFEDPYAITADSSGNLYVADATDHSIRKITSDGTVSTFAGKGGSFGSTDATGADARFRSPLGIAADSAGNLYVADTGNATIRKITQQGVVTTFAGSAGQTGSADGTGASARFMSPYGVAVDNSGTVFVVESSAVVRRITAEGVVTTLAGMSGTNGFTNGVGTAARFSVPFDIAVDGSGNLYVSDHGNHAVRKVTASGVVTTLAGSGSGGKTDGTGTAASFKFPSGIAADSAGNVYVADTDNQVIRKITSAGLVTTIGGTGSLGSTDGNGTAASFYNPKDVAVDGNGNLYIVDRGNHTIRKGSVQSGTPSGAPVCTLLASPSSITTGASTTLTASCSPAATSYIWTGGSCSSASATCTVTPSTTTTYTVTGSNTGGTSQAASATVTVSAATSTTSYTVPGTLGHDFFVLTAGNTYYGGGGNDTYIISPSTLSGTVTARIVDTEGDNIVQLVDGMTVSASTFYTDAAQLTLSNGAKVQILGAAKFKFQLGANAPAGDTATAMSYTDFVTSLGASLASGTLPVSGTTGYVVPTAFTQASIPSANLTTSASTVAGTLGDDVLVPSGGNNYLGGGGNDTYIISPYTLSGALTARIIDTEGANVIQLVGGLTITSSSFFNNAVQLTLSNGAIVQILGAASFSYQLGANAPAAQTASSQTYAQFAATLGASVPTGTSAVSGSANYVVQGSTSGTSTAPTGVTVTSVLPQTVGTRTIASSTRLQVNWTAPTAGAVNHYRVDARESIGSSTESTTALSSATGAEIGNLKAGTSYAITVTACDDAACSSGRGSSAINATTNEEYWQLQGSGSTFAGLTPIVSDGNARISATRFGDDANGVSAGRIQLYYGPRLSSAAPRASLSVAAGVATVDAGNPTSYTAFTSLAGSSGLMAPESSSTSIKGIGTGQGVPLSTSMGGKVRLFFEAEGPDGKTRIYSIDSVDGWVGRDFNASSSSICATASAFESGGDCAPTLVVGVEGDVGNSNAKVSNARQHKLGFPSLTDWRWDGASGTFLVFTIDKTTGCTTGNANHGYAVWDGTRWNVQYESSGGCPKMFKSAQAALPMHIGGVRYKMYYADTTTADATRPAGTTLPFLGPKVMIYGDGTRTGQTDRVDFEDWEAQSGARNVNFLWPNGDVLDATAEGFIDDYHFLTPTGNLSQQVMYMAITDGNQVPMGAAAILLNP